MTITTTKTHADGSRYELDGLLVSAGWSQLDTTEDASWYGCWASPKHRSVVSFCEGDITRTHADTIEEFVSEVRRVVAWHQRMGQWLGIDPGLLPEKKQAWIELGLADCLHI